MTLTPEERRCLHVLSLLERGQITIAQAAEGLELTPRQVRRLRRALQRHGPEGLAHNMGRSIFRLLTLEGASPRSASAAAPLRTPAPP